MRRREPETVSVTYVDPTIDQLKRTTGALTEARETLRLLIALDPLLDRFRVDGPWDVRVWDLDGMRLATKHLAGREAAAKYAPPEAS